MYQTTCFFSFLLDNLFVEFPNGDHWCVYHSQLLFLEESDQFTLDLSPANSSSRITYHHLITHASQVVPTIAVLPLVVVVSAVSDPYSVHRKREYMYIPSRWAKNSMGTRYGERKIATPEY